MSKRSWSITASIMLFALVHALTAAAAEDGVINTVSPSSVTNQLKPVRQTQQDILNTIDHNNKTLKKTVDWISDAYSGIKIKDLADIAPVEYAQYAKYVFKGNLYVLVHPGFYTFFETKDIPPSQKSVSEFPYENQFERLANAPNNNTVAMRVLVEQDRILREFVEFMSIKKRLLIVVLPRNYKEHLSAGYTDGQDEYARYINEMTNMSDSIVYIESEKWDNGKLSDSDRMKLMTFIKLAKVKKVLIGGGYLGKCVEDNYAEITKFMKREDVYYVPELLAISPNDMVTTSDPLIDPNDHILFGAIKKYLKSSSEVEPLFMNLTSFKVY